MLGFFIELHRQKNGGRLPATLNSDEGQRIAVWQTGLDGIDWLFELVKAGKAIDLGGGGYPDRFTAPAKEIIPRIIEGPPQARERWIAGAEQVVIGPWAGETKIDREALAGCKPDEWLLVQAWDES